MDGPAYTILKVEQLPLGGARVLVRIRGGQMLRLSVIAALNNGADIERLIGDLARRHLPKRPTT